MKNRYLNPAPTKDEAVEWASVADEALLPSDDVEDGDEVLVTSDGYVRKRVSGEWVVDTAKPRVYADDAARLARTGFTPEVGELFRVSGGLAYTAVDPTDPAQDDPLSSLGVTLAADSDPALEINGQELKLTLPVDDVCFTVLQANNSPTPAPSEVYEWSTAANGVWTNYFKITADPAIPTAVDKVVLPADGTPVTYYILGAAHNGNGVLWSAGFTTGQSVDFSWDGSQVVATATESRFKAAATNTSYQAESYNDLAGASAPYTVHPINFLTEVSGSNTPPMTGADGTNAGTAGTVPVPAATDDTKFLRGDATWSEIPSGIWNRITVDGTALTKPGNYRTTVANISFPDHTTMVGEEVNVFNDAIDGSPPVTITGTVLSPTGSVAPRTGVDASFSRTFVATATGWAPQFAQGRLTISLDDSDSGYELTRGPLHVITTAAAGTVVKLPSSTVSRCDVVLSAESTHPVTIEQFDQTAAALIENSTGVKVKEIVIQLTERNQIKTFAGRGPSTEWNYIEGTSPPSMVHIDADFDYVQYRMDNAIPHNYAIQITNISGNSGYNITLDGTKTLFMKDTKSIFASSVPNSTGFNIGPNAVATISCDPDTCYVTMQSSRDRGNFADAAALKAVPQNSLLEGFFATIGNRLFVFTRSGSGDDSETVLKPDDGNLNDRWISSLVDPASVLPNWQPNHDYVAGDKVVEGRLSDGVRVVWERNADGTSTGTFDATEVAEWTELGASELSLPVLQSVEVSVRGYVSSWTLAQNLVLTDIAGNDYDSATDWNIIGDTSNSLGDGRKLSGTAFSPPVNGERTITLQYVGPATRRGLSAIRVNTRGDAASTGLSRVKVKYFSGATKEEGKITAVAGLDNWNIADIDFFTDPQQPLTDPVADAAKFWDTAFDYVGANNQVFRLRTPATNANGVLTTIDGAELENSTDYFLTYDADRTALDSVPTIADNAATITEVALMRLIGPATKIDEEVIWMPNNGTTEIGKQNMMFSDDNAPTITPASTENQVYAIGQVQSTRAAWGLLSPTARAAVQVKISHWTSGASGTGSFVWLETEAPDTTETIEILSAAPAGQLPPGSYVIDTTANSFNIELENVKGHWAFSNPSNSLLTNPAGILSSGGTDAFTNAAGAQQVGNLLLDSDGMTVDIYNPDGGVNYYVAVDRTLGASSPFISGGFWNADTNTPDLSDPANQVDANGNLFVYNVSVSGNQDIGLGAEDFEVGGEIKWFAAGAYRYDAPGGDFAQFSTVEGYKALVGTDVTTVDSSVLVGFDPRYKSTFVSAAAGPGNALAMDAGTHDVELWFKDMTGTAINVGIVEAGHVAHRILDISSGDLTPSAAGADAGSAAITKTSFDDFGDNGVRIRFTLACDVAFTFRIGAYIADSTPAWQANMLWFISPNLAAENTNVGIQQFSQVFDSTPGGPNNQDAIANSAVGYYAPNIPVDLKAGLAKLDVTIKQETSNLESGTATGGTMEILSPADVVLQTFAIPARQWDLHTPYIENLPVSFDVPADGQYKLRWRNPDAPGAGYRISFSGLLHGTVTNYIGDISAPGPQGPQGDPGAAGAAGVKGDNGWMPVLAIATDANRRVLEVTDWSGGTGTKPTDLGYITAAGGLDADIANGADIRGPSGGVAEYHDVLADSQTNPRDTFVPSVSGSYKVLTSIGYFTVSNYGFWMGTANNASDIVNAQGSGVGDVGRIGTSHLFRKFGPVNLTAGETYHFGFWAGGGAASRDLRVDIVPA